MSLAVRAVSVNKGVDPRETAMIAFGGAGPLHAVAIAREIFIPRVIIPKLPGNFSALGMLMASVAAGFRPHADRPARRDRRRAVRRACSPNCAAPARRQLARDGIDASTADFDFAADLRYRRPGAYHRHSRSRDAEDLTGDIAADPRCVRRQHDRATAMPRPTSRSRSSICASSSPCRAWRTRIADAGCRQPWMPDDAGARAVPRRSCSTIRQCPLEARILWRPAPARPAPRSTGRP